MHKVFFSYFIRRCFMWQKLRSRIEKMRRHAVLHRPMRALRLMQLESLEIRCVLSTSYIATDLVSDQPGVAPIVDPHLINGWGIGLNPAGGAFWVSAEGADVSNLYAGDVGGSPLSKVPLEVDIPGGEPTGQVFNGTSDFVITNGTDSAPALFIFVSPSGAVTGWSPVVPPATSAQTAFQATDDAIYLGVTLANNGSGNFLYLADFHNAEVDVLDADFNLVNLAGSFTDPNLPAGFAPFNVAAIGGKLYVSYAKQDADAEEEVTGPHLGVVNVFDLNGNFVERLITGGKLNAPWGMVVAPGGFGEFSHDLLVGNFGDGRINAYDPDTGDFKGTLGQSPTHPIEIEGLWGLTFGNGVSAGDAKTLYYAAGPDDETHGLFGKITANPVGTNPVKAVLEDEKLIITGSRESDFIEVLPLNGGQQILVRAGNHSIGKFDAGAVGIIEIQGWSGNDRVNISQVINLPVIADGGAHNDRIRSGGGNSILLGGPDDDRLFASIGRDILIGGDGEDLLNGRGNDDLLIAGDTVYDTNTVALLQILDEWTSNDSYFTRVKKLRAGTGGLPVLDSTTVLNDHLHDDLIGGAGLDWFFARVDDTTDRISIEKLN